ncbi:MAG: hypothetical protein WBE26_12565 [Phycisphaerae bacterium]
MNTVAQLDIVIGLFGRLGIEVRQEHLGGGGGGLCVLHGRRLAFVDLDADPATRLECSLRALAACPELDNVYVPPVIRELIQQNEKVSG